MGKEREELEKIFEIANDSFLRNNRMLFETKVSERTLCGALMLELHEVLRKTRYFEYFVDVEYNRNAGGKLKTFKRTINEVAKMSLEQQKTQDKIYISEENDNYIKVQHKKGKIVIEGIYVDEEK